MNKTWTQILLFMSLAVGGCCTFLVVGQIVPWALWGAFFLFAGMTLPDSFCRKILHWWAIAVICWLAFIFLKVL